MNFEISFKLVSKKRVLISISVHKKYIPISYFMSSYGYSKFVTIGFQVNTRTVRKSKTALKESLKTANYIDN